MEKITKGLKDYQSQTLIGYRADGDYLPPSEDRNRNLEVIQRDCNAIQVTCYPSRWTGPFHYDVDCFNKWVNWGVEHNLPVMMHMLAGPTQYYPAWVKQAQWNGPELEFMFTEWIRNVMVSNDNFRKVNSWNVTNEIHTRGTGAYRTGDDSFLTILGWEKDESGLTGEARINEYHPRFMTKAYETSMKYAQGKLEMRDFDFEFEPDGRKAKALIQMAHHLRNKGIRIDAVGFQVHLLWNDEINYYDYDALKRNVDQFHEAGLEVYVTELDNPNTGGIEEQSKRWTDFYRACLEAGVEQIHTWGVADGVDFRWRDGQQPLLFDENFIEKPGYFAVQKALAQF